MSLATVQADYLSNVKWVKRLGEFFTQLDTDDNGYVSQEEWLLKVDNLAKVVTDRPDEMTKLREATLEFTTAVGLTEGVKADKKKFLELMAAFMIAEMDRVKRGEVALMEKLANVQFDVVDKNHDGSITFEEYKLVVKETMNFDEDAAKAIFNLIDQNKNGKIERKEFTTANGKFWCTLDDPSTQGMFGIRYE